MNWKTMKEEKYILSVIIPTRNRQKYAEAAVRSILTISERIQIIVSDNSDTDELKILLSDIIKKENVEYIYTPERIGGVDNYELAAQRAEGSFFIALGDDDTLLPNIIECAKWMNENEIDAVVPSKKLIYWWPDKESVKRKDGYLWVGPVTKKIELINPRAEVIKLLKEGGQDYLNLSLACSYHGLVRTSCMKKVKEITGRFYGGLSPDIYSACCLSLIKGIRVVRIDYPISLPGICATSTSAQSAKKTHVGKLETAPHFVGLKEKYTWNSMIPRYYSVETIWAETMLNAINKMGEGELIKEFFSTEKMVSRFINNNIEKKEEILNEVGEGFAEIISNVKYCKPQNSNIIQKIYHKSIYEVELLLGKQYRMTKCDSIAEAETQICIHFNKRRYVKVWNSICNRTI